MHTPHQNHYLFSDYYLNEILPTHEEWKAEDIQKAIGDITALFHEVKDLLPGSNEAQTEERFIRPVLKLLGNVFEVQPPVKTTFDTGTPDYAFFPEEEARKKAHKSRGKKDYFKNALAVGDAKYWDRPLDKKLSAQGDPFENNNPSLQIDTYLRSTGIRWGILTNGRLWRLYNRDTSYRLDTYYQIDLVQFIERQDSEAFKYFYLFFRKEAFLPAYPERKTFLNLIYSKSIDYARRVGAELKENVYESLRLLATGFLGMEKNALGPQNLEEIRSNALVLLYRLLFIFYAEARNLLPLDNDSYKNNYSLHSLKNEIKMKTKRGEVLAPEATIYWDRLKGLFELINRGSKQLGVPAYNGGLFKPENHPLLEQRAVGDSLLVSVIDKLARSKDPNIGRVFVDYRSLDVRDLGSIYEGLLEYQLRMAEEDLVVTKKNTYLPLKEAEKKTGTEVVRKGELYLVTDKGERKATGSYYTPEYIVNYIVENTLGPIVEKIEEDIRRRCEGLKEKVKTSRGSNRKAYQKELEQVKTSFDDEVLKLKVLDPAMGSGHFLVRATEFLAEHIATNPYAHDVKAPEGETAIDYWKRRVVEHCIYGVDVNPLAVELAKLSLWLKTVARGKPLSFLDHHLRCGNSLVGARVEDLGTLPEVRVRGSKSKGSKKTSQVEQIEFDFATFTQDIALAVGDMLQIEQKPTDTIKDVEDKTEILHRLDVARREKYRQIANLRISAYFGNDLSVPVYRDAGNRLKSGTTVISMTPEKDLQAVLAKARSLAIEKHFFHWELEFPEVFFDQYGRRLKNPGFDAVMGNPPWEIVLGKEAKENKKKLLEETKYFKERFVQLKGEINLYKAFMCLGLDTLRSQGYFGFIVPSTVRADNSCSDIRRAIIEGTRVNKIAEFPESAKVFPDVTQSCLVIIWQQGDKSQQIPLAIGLQNEQDLKKASFIPIDTEICRRLDRERIPLPSVTDKEYKILSKISENPSFADCGAKIFEGEVHLTAFKDCLSQDSRFPPLLRGEHIYRYITDRAEAQNKLAWINAELYRSMAGSSGKALHHRFARIAYQQVANMQLDRRLRANVVGEGNYLGNTLGYILPFGRYNILFVLAVLCSKLLNWRFKLTSTNNHILVSDIDALPLHRIAFVTPEPLRKRREEEVKSIYQESSKVQGFALEGSSPKGSGVEKFKGLLKLVEQCLEKIHAPDPELVKKHNSEEINKDWQIPEGEPWEQSDVVHDVLAFLAEEMINMNKEKQAETKGFLGWLESELGKKIDELKGKTRIREYYSEDFDRLWNTLKENEKSLRLSLGKDSHGKLQEEFERSVARLRPLIERIERTDWLIDQIVYKLYGLTEEEIEVVERGSRV